MRTTVFSLIGLLVASLGLSPARAAVLTFDDLDPPTGFGTGDLSFIGASNYGGLTWGPGWTLAATSGPFASLLFASAAHSGDRVLYNGGLSDNLTVSSSALFDFDGAWFSTIDPASPFTSSWINITAYDAADNIIGSTGQVALGLDPIFIAAMFSDVFRLTITREFGQFMIDDFTFSFATDPSEVPLPAALPLFLAGLAGFAAAARRRLAQS